MKEKKKFRIIVLAKQVPDTRNVGKDAMKEDGTINRAALPAIYNPEDLNALELALRIKDKNPDAEILIITMGPPRASEIIRESLYRGADGGVLITDRRFAGSDTLATSYALAMAVKKFMPFDLVLCGRQAIDGDTAQVGPQIAEKLSIPQITYAEEIFGINDKEVIVKRRLENGVEKVKSSLPALITVHSSAPDCRPRNAKFLMKYKHAHTQSEELKPEYNDILKNRNSLNILQWSVDDIDADFGKLGLTGSPTKVKTINNVVLQQKDSKVLTCCDNDIKDLVNDLISNHIIG